MQMLRAESHAFEQPGHAHADLRAVQFLVNVEWLADELLQGADAKTVTWSCALTAEVESVTEALLAPTATVTGPVQAGEPIQPGKVAI